MQKWFNEGVKGLLRGGWVPVSLMLKGGGVEGWWC